MEFENETVSTPEADIICLETLSIDKVDWLWHPFLPLGKVTILQGDPGEGKTTLALQLAALVSRGVMYGSEKIGHPQNVLYLTAEDGIRDTILPRLVQAKADCRHIYTIEDGGVPLTMTDPRLEEAIDQYMPSLVIIDPLQAFLGADVDMHRANEIRPVMASLSQIAYRHCCAVVLIGHMNKQMGNKSLYRGLGSIDLTASARSVLLMARDPKEQDVRVLLHIKSSLAKEGKPQAFRLTEENGLQWEGDYEGNLPSLLTADSAVETPSRVEEGIALLKEVLAEGEMPSKELRKLAKEREISQNALSRAKKRLGVLSRKREGVWYSMLPTAKKKTEPAPEPEPELSLEEEFPYQTL